MKSLKNHFSVIFPLIVLLSSLQFTFGLEKIVEQYEKKLTQDYSIVIVATKKLDENEIKKEISTFSSLEPVSTESILNKLKDDISSNNLSLLKASLPKFYSLKLTSFPNANALKKIKQKLIKNTQIKKVEIFAKTHSKIYKIFVVAKSMAYIFTLFIFVISLLLMLKQMRIWVLEHKERMDIMTFFGASFWMKSAPLYRLAITDSIISTLIVIIIFSFGQNLKYIKEITSELQIIAPRIAIFSEGTILLFVALFFALISVSLVMVKVRKA